MEDSKIIDLYWERNEKAISATEQKYGSYCYYIAYNIGKIPCNSAVGFIDHYLLGKSFFAHPTEINIELQITHVPATSHSGCCVLHLL